MRNILFLIGTILIQSIQIQLSQKQKPFSQVFNVFFEFRLIFERFFKKDEPHTSSVLENIDFERRG